MFPHRRRSRSIVTMPAWIVVTLVLAASATSDSIAADFIREETLADTFRQYDFDPYELDNVECRDDMAHALCPSEIEDSVPCAGIGTIENFCRRILGEDLVRESGGLSTSVGEGNNALSGCINYVSWDEEKLSCCPSNYCADLTLDEEELRWGDWELAREDEEEEEGYVYEYANELHLLYDDEVYYEDEVEEELFEKDTEYLDDLVGSQSEYIEQVSQDERDERRLDDSLNKDPLVHIPPAST